MIMLTIRRISRKELLRILLFISLSKHPYVCCITNVLFRFLRVLYIDRYCCRFLITRTTLLVLLFEAYTTRFATTYNEAIGGCWYVKSRFRLLLPPSFLFFFLIVLYNFTLRFPVAWRLRNKMANTPKRHGQRSTEANDN